MSNYNHSDSLDFMLSTNMGTSESTKDLMVLDKDFSTEWLKVKEKNLIQMGGNLTDPAQNSYLVYKCVTVISENIATVPIILFDKLHMNPIPITDPLYKNFHEPNPYDNWDDLMSSLSTFYTLYGELFIAVVPKPGKGFQMWSLDPRLMKEVINLDTGMLEGWIFNKKIPFELDEVVQVKRRNPYNQWRGLSPLVAAAVELNIDYKASKYQNGLLNNGAVPGGIITIPENALMSPEEMKKIQQTWQSRHQGPDKSSKVAVLKSGLTYTPIAMDNDKMQFIDTRKYTRDAILMTFGVPSVVAGITEGVNRTSAEAQLKLFWRVTIKPQLERINSKILWDILPRFYPNIASSFDYRKIDELQKDFTINAEVAKKFFSMGFSRNELNRRFDFGFNEDLDTGDIRYVPLNLVDTSLRIYADEGKLGEGGGEDGGPDIDPSDDLPLPNQAKSINDVKIKMIVPKMRNFFKDQKKRMVKMVATSDVKDKFIIKHVGDLIKNDKEKFRKRFTPFFIEMITTIQKQNEGIDPEETEFDVDQQFFEDNFNKILTVFDLIYTKIGKKLIENPEDTERNITSIKEIYVDVNKYLEENLLRFNKQLEGSYNE
jgi:HK97 family phage portal protein